MKLSCSAKKKQPPPDPSPEAGLAGGLAGGLEAGVDRGRPRGGPRGTGRQGKPSKTFQTSTPFKTLQTPSPTGTPGPRPLLNQAPQGQGHSNGFLLAFKAAVCQPANTPNAPQPSKHHPKPSKHHPKPPNPPGLEACFEQVAQGLWLVRRVHRRSKNHIAPREARTPDLEVSSLPL